MRPPVMLLLALCTACIGVAACRASPSKPVPAPSALPSFYAVPAGVAHKATGTLLKSEPVPAPGVHGTVRRVMYASRDARGRSVAVTGLVVVPLTPPPPGGYPVVSWAHGTNGMADQCAPSLDPASALPLAAANALLALDWAVLATDYQGEGTPPGLLAFLVGDVAARNAIDIVLAARRVPSVHLGDAYIVWGHSEGGQSALFAWDLAATYGSRDGIHMVGAVAGAPPSQLPTLYPHLSTTPYRVYDYMMLAGFNAGYGQGAAPLDAVLAPRGVALLPTLAKGCLASVTAAVNTYPYSQLVKADPLGLPGWRKLFVQNDPASFRSAAKVPLLIVHGGDDEVIPVESSGTLAQHLCGLGADLQRWVYPGQSHGSVVVAAALDIGHWMAARFAGQSTAVRYQPADEAGVQIDACRAADGR